MEKELHEILITRARRQQRLSRFLVAPEICGEHVSLFLLKSISHHQFIILLLQCVAAAETVLVTGGESNTRRVCKHGPLFQIGAPFMDHLCKCDVHLQRLT
jgi:hypothetical protein